MPNTTIVVGMSADIAWRDRATIRLVCPAARCCATRAATRKAAAQARHIGAAAGADDQFSPARQGFVRFSDFRNFFS
jgi:hypothetical protein